jgi:hypothetical protein
VTEQQDSRAAAIQLLQSVEGLLKDSRLALDFARRGVNTSLALVAVQGLIAYLNGDKSQAADDLAPSSKRSAHAWKRPNRRPAARSHE